VQQVAQASKEETANSKADSKADSKAEKQAAAVPPPPPPPPALAGGDKSKPPPSPLPRQPQRQQFVVEATRFRDDNKDGDYVDRDFEDHSSAFLVAKSPVVMADLNVVYGLGKGGFSAVMLVQRKSDHEFFALKVINKSMIREPKHRKRLQVERVLLTSLPKSPFIASLTSAFQTDSELFFLMDYCAGGDLCYQCFRIFSKIDRFNDGQARFYISQITLAVEHLHKFGYVHRDIKPENIMMDATGHLKLIDFGLCKRIRNDEELKELHGQDRARMAPGLEPMSPCGSLAFVPPETLDQLGSFAGDWWGLGVIAFELLTGHFPWRNVGTDDDDALRAEIRSGRVEYPDFLSALAASLLKGLLEKAVPKRLGYFTSNQIKTHGFFKGLDWERAMRRDYDPPFHPCRPKKYRDPADGTTKVRVEAVMGIGNFGKDQRDLAMEFYKRSRRGEVMNPQSLTAVALPASLTVHGLKLAKTTKKPPITQAWPVFRGFDLALERPPAGSPPTLPPPAKKPSTTSVE